jgi:uncharacterized phage infection (PIP) family protein YhgE
MKKSQRSLALLPLIAFVAAAALQSCASSGHDQATETASKMTDLRTAVVMTKEAIVPVSASLTDLLKDNTDAKSAYDRFVKSSDALVDATKKTQTVLGDIRAQGSAYFAEWEKQNAAITDPGIKKASDERRADLSKKLDGLTKEMSDVAATYPPYLQRIKDARTFLSNDLTKAGIKSMDSTISHLINEGGEVSKALDGVIKELDATIPAFQAQKPPPPPK